jgi:hypothetical protein
MYNVPWQKGRVFESPVGVLTASFLLRPNTMFHPEGEWSVRLVLPPQDAYRLRQIVTPAHDDIVARAKALYGRLPVEEQASRPFKENPFWQAASVKGIYETEDVYFTFRLPTIDRRIGKSRLPRLKLLASDAAAKPEVTKPARRKPATAKVKSAAVTAEAAVATPDVTTHVPLLDRRGQVITNMSLEPDGWEATVSFSIQQYWLRSFGAGVTLRLNKVQLFAQRQRQGGSDESDLPLPIAL